MASTWSRSRLVLIIMVAAVLSSLLATVPRTEVAAQTPPPPPPPTVSNLGTYHSLTSVGRLMDTRTGLNVRRGALGRRVSRTVRVTGRAGVPRTGVSAVVLNVVGLSPRSGGGLYLHARDARRPALPSVALQRGKTASTTVVVRVPTSGQLTLFNTTRRAHVAVDVLGWYDRQQPFGPGQRAPGHRYVAKPVRRLVDSRVGMGVRRGALPRRASRTVQVTGRAGVPRRGVSAVALNVVGLSPRGDGGLYLHARGARRPALPSVALQRGKTTPATVVVRVPASGQLTLFNTTRRAHVAINVLGWYATARGHVDGQFAAMNARRVIDTRVGVGVRKAPVGRRAALDLRLAGRAGIPRGGASAVALNVTGLNGPGAGGLYLHARGSRRPALPSLVLTPRATGATTVVVQLPRSGRLTLYSTARRAHVAIDLLGWYTSAAVLPPPPPGPPPAPPGEAPGSTDGSLPEGKADAQPPHDTAHLDAIVQHPAGKTVAELRRFWTPERIVKASSAEGELPNRGADGIGAGSENEPLYTGPQPRYPILQQGYMPTQWYGAAVGRLLFYVPSQRSFSNCSGTVVGRGLVLTAAHCVVEGGMHNTNFMFVPSQRGTQAPYGNWYANGPASYYSYYLTTRNPHFHNQEFWPLDYAFIKFGPQNGGRSIETVTGSIPIMWDAPTANKWSMGYPSEGAYFSRYCTHGSNPNVNSCWQYYCYSPVGAYVQSYPRWYEVGWGCNSSGGTSGGPVLQQYNGRWYVSSVNSNAPALIVEPDGRTRRFSKNMWGPYFNSWVGDLFRRLGG